MSEPMSWRDALLEFEAWQQSAGYSARTVGNYQQLLLQLSRAVAKPPGEVTLADLLDRQRRPIAQSSRQRDRSYYRVFFRWLLAEGYTAKDPSARLPMVRVPRGKPRPFTLAQLQTMVDTTTHRHTRTMILLGAYQGMRAGEIARVRGEMFDLTNNRVRYVGKGGFEHDQEIHPLVRAEVWHYKRHGYWFEGRKGNEGSHIHPKSVSDLMSRAIDRAGMDSSRLTGHSLRHFFGTQLYQAGIDIRTVQELMGHQSLNSTQVYTQVAPERMHDGLNSLPLVDLPRPPTARKHRRTRPRSAS